jgi:hypothetical protein
MTAEHLGPGGGPPDGPVEVSASFLDPLVDRLSAQYVLDRRAVRSLAVEALASFAGARVQAFVPVLVEKRVRDGCRGLGRGGSVPVALDGSVAFDQPGTDVG